MAAVYTGNADLAMEYFKDAATGNEPLAVITQAAIDRWVLWVTIEESVAVEESGHWATDSANTIHLGWVQEE